MAKRQRTQCPYNLMDWVRPIESDGPLLGAVLSTYGLDLDQADLLGKDLLPTMLGLGGVRDRAYACPVGLDRHLGNTQVVLACNAHAVAGGVRPSLRVDVIPIGHRVHHAKVLLIHRRRRIRMIVGSANLTNEGFRRFREVAAVLDFYPGGRLPPAVLDRAIDRWVEALGEAADPSLLHVLETARIAAQDWQTSDTPPSLPEVVFGGGSQPLWKQLVEGWPKGEPVLDWQICSPFWPQIEDGLSHNPFEAIAAGLAQRGATLEDCRLELIARADAPSEVALPLFPFPLIKYLQDQGFPVPQGQILPARLDAAPDELMERRSPENRDLHAKWMVLAGPRTMVALLGSANFTRRGLGVLSGRHEANIEAGVLLIQPRGSWTPRDWRPPIRGQAVDWASSPTNEPLESTEEEVEQFDWPSFIQRIELNVRWERLPDPDGQLRVALTTSHTGGFQVQFCGLGMPGSPEGQVLCPDGMGPVVHFELTPNQIRYVLTRPVLRIVWEQGKRSSYFPINIAAESRSGIPTVLGAKPSEEQLLAYFHGRIDEEDLISDLRSHGTDLSSVTRPDADTAERLRQLQNYVVREFVESLYGLAETLERASYSPRALEQAMLGDLSPIGLAERVVHAAYTGQRSATAAAFQLLELIRVLSELKLVAPGTAPEAGDLEEVRRRAIDRIFAMIEGGKTRSVLAQVLKNKEFNSLADSLLPGPLAGRWRALGNDIKDSLKGRALEEKP